MRNIIVNADDFGISPSVNKAIVKLFNDGLINSTTLMANMSGFDEAIELAHQNHLTNNIGAHLVLTAGKPLTDEIYALPYLFTKNINSKVYYFKKFFFLSKYQKTLIFNEYCHQIEKIRKNGIQISHLDTHHQMHDIYGITEILLLLLKTYKIPSIRILNNLDATEYYKNAYRGLINSYLKRKGVNFSTFFGNQMDFSARIKKNAHFTKDQSVEIMVHPDFNSDGKLIDIIHTKEYDFQYLHILRESWNEY